MICIRCGRQTKFWQQRHAPRSTRIAGNTYQTARGAVFIGDASAPIAVYCARCVRAGIRICRDCGCTDECGCPEACSWVERDLCSSCQRNQHQLAALRNPATLRNPSGLFGLAINGAHL